MNAEDGSVIVADGSASINAEDEVAAFDAAQTKLQETAAGDTVLLANAQQRAQFLLEDYLTEMKKFELCAGLKPNYCFFPCYKR